MHCSVLHEIHIANIVLYSTRTKMVACFVFPDSRLALEEGFFKLRLFLPLVLNP